MVQNDMTNYQLGRLLYLSGGRTLFQMYYNEKGNLALLIQVNCIGETNFLYIFRIN